jgi:transcriptional regulator with GAF, ATPase, and Fis domain
LKKLNILQNRLQEENIYLREEIEVVHNFQEIIGQSQVIKHLLKKVTQVASTDATVLLLGETGTGKELIARAVHNSSIRKDRALVKVNCAALPHNLIESSLFGHKKGAFTGAVSDNTGKFELADGGTIFLDEIGELPLELQTKLLRVLQDGEFEKLGQPNAIKVDVRVIAATNRNLEKMIETKKFRQDLYYRLNVFPIKCPPLRDRKGDVPILAKYFIDKYNLKIGRNVSRISKKIINIFESYHWPGNVRELENIIERALIISQGEELTIGNWFYQDGHQSNDDTTSTLQDIECKHIKKILESTSWRVSGKGGAAEKLGLKPTTLEARMRKLGILRPK